MSPEAPPSLALAVAIEIVPWEEQELDGSPKSLLFRALFTALEPPGGTRLDVDCSSLSSSTSVPRADHHVTTLVLEGWPVRCPPAFDSAAVDR